MVDFFGNAIIHRPLEEVFSFAANLENMPLYMSNVLGMEKITEGPIRVGSIFIETRNIRGKEGKTEWEIIEFRQNKSYVISGVSNGLTILYRYTFEEIVEGTQAQFFAEMKTQGWFMKLTKPFLVKMIKQEDGDNLRHLKEVLESEKQQT
ncbi:SRPBCC family protein [Bacillus sp. 1NLA3E]|uniref:SRPBCC family protein n=1 Tax=Bacillus sp. 1NLA3E TaxID=666686 RepID=UPI000247EF95|nr:SRPBCC family protein [Bacillus sp. 1NLA3E]AGK56109.1 hypothetical protein B1NLA3E_21855 [Bacillus sp. 1NLA3E]